MQKLERETFFVILKTTDSIHLGIVLFDRELLGLGFKYEVDDGIS